MKRDNVWLGWRGRLSAARVRACVRAHLLLHYHLERPRTRCCWLLATFSTLARSLARRRSTLENTSPPKATKQPTNLCTSIRQTDTLTCLVSPSPHKKIGVFSDLYSQRWQDWMGWDERLSRLTTHLGTESTLGAFFFRQFARRVYHHAIDCCCAILTTR